MSPAAPESTRSRRPDGPGQPGRPRRPAGSDRPGRSPGPVRSRHSGRGGPDRAWLRRQRAVVRTRLATPPPPHLAGPADEGTGPSGSANPGRLGPRRTRLRLALAALPLLLAVALYALTGARPDSAPSDPAPPAGSPPTVPSAPARTAGPADVPPGIPHGGTPSAGRAPDAADARASGAEAVPAPPPGHRPVAVRVGDPAALALVSPGDRVDVVGMDGNVLAEGLEVLQGGTGGGSALVLAVPDGRAAALAGAVLSLDVTVIRSAGAR